MCPRGDLNPGTGEISLITGLNPKTGEKSPDRGFHAARIAGWGPRVSSTEPGMRVSLRVVAAASFADPAVSSPCWNPEMLVVRVDG